MGQGTNGVEAGGESTPPPERLEREVEEIRENLDDIVGELDRRRRELTDWRLMARRHRSKLVAAGASLAAIMLSFVVVTFMRHRRAASLRGRAHGLGEKARRLRQALARMIDDPDMVAKSSPSIGHKIAAAVGSTIAVAISKRLVQRLLKKEPENTSTALVLREPIRHY